MALGLSTESSGSGGDILPIVKWDAKGGDFIRQDRYQAGDGTWQKDEQEIAFPVQVAMDLQNIEVGWLSFASGRPDFQMVKLGEAMPAKPSDDHKQTFRVRLMNKELGLREFSSQSKMVLSAFDQLHNAYEAGKADNAGKMPVVEVTGTKTITVNTPQGEQRFKVPEWKITEWIDRPASFDGASAPSASVPEPKAPVEETGSDLF